MNCTDSPVCTLLHRDSCLLTSHTCSSCVTGFTGKPTLALVTHSHPHSPKFTHHYFLFRLYLSLHQPHTRSYAIRLITIPTTYPITYLSLSVPTAHKISHSPSLSHHSLTLIYPLSLSPYLLLPLASTLTWL